MSNDLDKMGGGMEYALMVTGLPPFRLTQLQAEQVEDIFEHRTDCHAIDISGPDGQVMTIPRHAIVGLMRKPRAAKSPIIIPR